MLLAAIAMLTWATLPVVLTLALVYLDPWTLTWFRFLVAAVVLSVWLLRRGVLASAGGRPSRKLWPLLLVAALTLSANYMLYILGLELTTPAVAQVLIQMAPVLMGLGGIWLFGERYSNSQWAGFAILVMGLVVFFRTQLGSFTAGDEQLWQGALLILLGSIAWATYAMVQKRLLKDYSSVAVMVFIYVFATIAIFPATEPSSLMGLAPIAWPLIAFCALNTLVAYSAFAEALNHWEASRVSAVLALTPLATLAFVMSVEWLYPGVLPPEHLDWLSLTGAGLVVTGSLVTSLTGRKARKDAVTSLE
jgi:drug/metabolite transporter (DMT)-like permease